MEVLKDIAEQVQLGDDERVSALTAQAIEHRFRVLRPPLPLH